MRFSVLGPLRVGEDEREIPLGGPRHRTLLAALLVHPGRAVSGGKLMDVLWGPSPPKSAADMLHVRVSELRRILRTTASEEDPLAHSPDGYLIDASGDDIDAILFERLSGEGTRLLAHGDPEQASTRLSAALDLWRGAPLPEVAESDYARPRIAELTDLHLKTLESVIEAELLCGRHREVVGRVRNLVAEHPLRERFHHHLMLALYRSGRQAESLGAYDALARRFAEELGIDPGPELQDLRLRILRQDERLVIPAAIMPPDAAPRDNLPHPLSSFVGRGREQTELDALLRSSRLISIVGVGGVGKSRLAVEVARKHTSDNPGGVWLIELSPLSDPRLVIPSTAHVLGVLEHRDRDLFDQLMLSLKPSTTLLVFDNCEHLVDTVAGFVARLLDECPRLRVICTSRERLQVVGESVFALDGLRSDVDPERSRAVPEAVTLFCERASAAQLQFQPAQEDVGDIVDICRALDGIPLAIELAAARLGVMGLSQIVSRLDDPFHLLDVGVRTADHRHRTLTAVVDWSFHLLPGPERAVFLTLSTFVGGFTLEAAEAVCGPSAAAEDVTHVLERLVNKSLVQADRKGSSVYRYRLLDTLRAYGIDKLRESGGLDTAAAAHAAYFGALAAAAREGLRGRDQPRWLEQLGIEHDNIRAALGWLASFGSDGAAQIAAAIYPFWDLRGHYSEGRGRIEDILATGSLPPRLRGQCLMGVATLAAIQGDGDRADSACKEAVTLSSQSGDHAGLAHALSYRGFIRIWTGDLAAADEFLARAFAVAHAAGARWEEAWTLLFQATVALAAGRREQALTLTACSDAALEGAADLELVGWNHLARASAYVGLSEWGSARMALLEGLEVFARLGGMWGLSQGLMLAGVLSARSRRHVEAARLIGGGERLRDLAGTTQFEFLASTFADSKDVVREALGPAAFHAEWSLGAARQRSATVAAALRSLEPPFSGT